MKTTEIMTDEKKKAKVEKLVAELEKALEDMTKDEANRLLSHNLKRQWVRVHTRTANTYYLDWKTNMIKDVDPAGWYY